MPGRSLQLLLAGCLAVISWGCTEKRAEFFNWFAGRDLLALANDAVDPSFKTLGDCTAASDAYLQPCRSVPAFPVHTRGKDWEITVSYATGLDTFSVTNVSLRCDPTSAAAPAELGWFAELDGTIRDLGINVTAHVDFPQMRKSTLEKFANLTAHVVARVSCVDGDTLKMALDPAEDSLNLSKMELGFSFLSIDLSPYLVRLLRHLFLKGTTFTPPAAWGPVMAEVCAVTAPELDFSLLI